MAIGTEVIKTVGKLVFDLQRGEETTTRTVDIAYPKTDTTGDTLQNLVNQTNATYTDASNSYNILVQPANWRDTKLDEDVWTTTGVHYEIVTTTTTPITAESSNG